MPKPLRQPFRPGFLAVALLALAGLIGSAVRADGPKDCLVVHNLPGCEDATCTSAVCVVRPQCCTVTWDSDCVSVAEQVCVGCGLTSDSCFISHAKPSCRDESCCESVCADPDYAYCCNEDWDFGCAIRASELCSSTPVACGDPTAGSCLSPHGTPSCRDAACCENVCGIWPSCCQLAWDSTCVMLASQLCAQGCNPGCPEGSIAESEACHALTNDPVFSPGTTLGVPQALPPDQTLCGALVATETNPSRNDVDVFLVNLSGLDTDGDGKVKVRLRLVAGASAFAALVPTGSSAATLAASSTLRVNSTGCQGTMDWACRAPGLWWLVVAAGSNGVIAPAPTACDDARYQVRLEVEAACAPRCGSSPDSCIEPHAGTSCNDAACCASVCGVQPECCDTGWDADCAIRAAALCGAAPPANDTCATPTVVGVGSTPFSLLGATLDGIATPPSCGSASSTSDIWFQFTPSASGETQVTTCGTELDTRLQVLSGGCGVDAISLACNDDSGFCAPSTKASRLSFIADCGVPYLIRVSGVAGATGFGTLVIEEPNGFPCCRADLDGSREVDLGDVAICLLDYGPCPDCSTDMDGSGNVDLGDVALILLDFGPCP